MTAASLIEFLRNHPKTCGVLGIGGVLRSSYFVRNDYKHLGISNRSHKKELARFETWLLGASTAKADEMRVEALRAVGKSGNEWFWFNLDSLETSDNNYPSRLHATFAAIEAALDKETT